MKSAWLKRGTLALAILAVILLILILVRRRRKNKQTLPQFVPSGDFNGAQWPNPDDKQKCLSAFNQVDPGCQSNPISDRIACSDYPFFYCNGRLRASGDLDQGNCPYGSPIAYSANECNNPRTTRMDSAYLCGGTLDPCVDKNRSGMNCQAVAPSNPWGATNLCHPE